jgi:hypothetical protein
MAIRANPRTTVAGATGALSLLAGLAGSYHSGRVAPVLVGLVVKLALDVVAHALAADAKPPKEAP